MNRRDSLLLFLAISLLMHLFLVLTSASYLEKKKLEESPAVELMLLNRTHQIADIEPPEKEQRPQEAKFIGIYDSTVENEQVSEAQAQPASPRQTPADSPRVNEYRSDGVSAHPVPRRSAPMDEPDYFNPVPGDFFPDYKKGDRTYLNVLRFPKVEYFVRLKKIFRTTFDPVPSLRSSMMTTQISKGQVEVRLAVSIDRFGNLDELFVINSSGLPLYDAEAKRTIKASSPFAKPPADLLDTSSKLRMVWTFTVYL